MKLAAGAALSALTFRRTGGRVRTASRPSVCASVDHHSKFATTQHSKQLVVNKIDNQKEVYFFIEVSELLVHDTTTKK